MPDSADHDGTLETYLAIIAARLPSSLRDRLCNEIREHLEESVHARTKQGLAPATAAERSCRRMGDPRLLARTYLLADARRSFHSDALCLHALALTTATLASAIVAVLGILLLHRLAPAPGGPLEFIGYWSGLGRAWASALLGPAAYFLYLRRGGNPFRVAPFLTASLLAVLLLLPLRLELSTRVPDAAFRWQAVAYLDLPVFAGRGWELCSVALRLDGNALGPPERTRLDRVVAPLEPGVAASFVTIILVAGAGGVVMLRRRAKELHR
jgi:hypothetical protein